MVPLPPLRGVGETSEPDAPGGQTAAMPPLPAHPRDWPIPPMDKEAGWKETAFTWPMGQLILARIWAGETMTAITADPRMPAYCTVFRWMQVVPEFGEAVAQV